jgi:hypothetical protein
MKNIISLRQMCVCVCVCGLANSSNDVSLITLSVQQIVEFENSCDWRDGEAVGVER